MLVKTDTPIETVISLFVDRGIDISFLVPTANGYKKSIMDAISPLRSFLETNDLHNYDQQLQGQQSKVLVPSFFIFPDKACETVASLYRPNTKQGDPRIWFAGLKNYCLPENLLGIVTDKECLYIFNLSNVDIINSIRNGEYAAKVLDKIAENEGVVAEELLSKLNALHQMGFVTTTVNGDTGVGMTAENFLGIQPNSSKSPDYKGIELKCSRKKQRQPNRVNLFSQVPDWGNSKGINAKKLLTNHGYWAEDGEKKRFNLYCTVEAHRPNPQGLFFVVDNKNDILVNYRKKDSVDQYVVQWNMKLLRERLLEKHKETFWVKATSKYINGIEHFRYDSIVHTKRPTASILGYLFESRVITMDYTMHLKENGQVRDHGYLFKIKPNDVELLFPDPVEYILDGNS